jgi:hypothetical protein
MGYSKKKAIIIDSDGNCSRGNVIIDKEFRNDYGEPSKVTRTTTLKGWGKFDGKREVRQFENAVWEFVV